MAHYVYTDSNPIQFFDPSGTLTQKKSEYELEAFKKLESCGRYWISFEWQLAENENNGLIIQYVVFTYPKIDRCRAADKTDNADFVEIPNKQRCSLGTSDGQETAAYFEIWRVKDGKIFTGKVFDEMPSDDSKYDIFAYSGTVGCTKSSKILKQRGVAFFIPDSLWKGKKENLDAFKRFFVTGEKGAANAGALFSACATNPEAKELYEKLTKSELVKSSRTTKEITNTWDCCKDQKNIPGEPKIKSIE